MIFKESQLFCEGKITALPHNFQPNTWVRGGICLVHLRPFVSKTPQIFRSILQLLLFSVKQLTNAMLPSCAPPEGPGGWDTCARSEPAKLGAPYTPHRWLATWRDACIGHSFLPLIWVFSSLWKMRFSSFFHLENLRILKIFVPAAVRC